MFKITHHPKAFLALKRNVRQGLLARTKIVLILEKKASNTKGIMQETGLSYASVLHHVHLLEAENILTRKGKRPYLWELTGAGQQRLTDVGGTSSYNNTCARLRFKKKNTLTNIM